MSLHLNQQSSAMSTSDNNTTVNKKWTKEELQKMLKDGKAHMIPANWTKSESWLPFKCVEVNDQVRIT